MPPTLTMSSRQEGTQMPDPTQTPTESLEDKVAARLTEISESRYATEDEDPAPEPEQNLDESDEDGEQDVGEDSRTESEQDDSESEQNPDETLESADDDAESDPDDDGEAAADEAPTLPDAHRRSLIAYGWTPDEIEEALTDDPDRFSRTAEKVHSSRVKQSSEWAQLGREKRAEQTPSPNPQPQAGDPAKSSLQAVDVAKLKEEYGDDELIDRLATPLNQAVEQINQLLPVIEQSKQLQQQAAEQQLQQAVDGFFQSPSMTSYNELYGESFSNASQEQFDRRQKVLATADAIIIGAAAQGRQLDFNEAMSHAHDIESAEFRTKAVRDELQGKVQKRTRNITQRPAKKATSSSASQRQSGPLTEEQLRRRVQKRLDAARR